jgi:hypothetical protein
MDEALIRLECLKLACSRAALPADAVRVAGEFEAYVKGPPATAKTTGTLHLRKSDKPA